MKVNFLIFMFFLSAGIVCAQENRFAGIPSDGVISGYLSEAKAYALLYSGKTETPYDRQFVNHPYLETHNASGIMPDSNSKLPGTQSNIAIKNNYMPGTLVYNRLVYKDVWMRFDLYRNELTVISIDMPYPVVLNNEKFDYAVLNGLTIILFGGEKKSKKKFVALLQNGN